LTIFKAETKQRVCLTSLETEEKGIYMLWGQGDLGSLLPNRRVGSSISVCPPQSCGKIWGLRTGK